MPDAVHDYCQLYAVTATGAGDALGIGGERVRYGLGSGVNRNGFTLHAKARIFLTDSTTGATATVKVQESNDNSSWTDVFSVAFSIGTATPGNQQSQARLFSTTKQFIRFNVTALAGGAAPTVYGYFTVPTGV